MNKDKIMIEEMAKVLCDKNCEECSSKLLLPCGYKTYCTKLYNANCRIISDDEIVLKKSQYEAEKEKAFLEWREEYDQNCLLRLRVSEFEKELAKLKAQNETLELNNKKLKQTNDEFVKANKAFAKRNEELLDELQELTDIKAKAKQETATEILQVVDKRLDLYRNGVIGGTLYDAGYQNAVNEIKIAIKNKFGIESE